MLPVLKVFLQVYEPEKTPNDPRRINSLMDKVGESIDRDGDTLTNCKSHAKKSVSLDLFDIRGIVCKKILGQARGTTTAWLLSFLFMPTESESTGKPGK